MACFEYYVKLYLNIPKIKRCYAIILFLINIILPGIGTILFIPFNEENNYKDCKEFLLTGLIQFLFCWTIVPWIWSILWGVFLLKKSFSHKKKKKYQTPDNTESNLQDKKESQNIIEKKEEEEKPIKKKTVQNKEEIKNEKELNLNENNYEIYKKKDI